MYVSVIAVVGLGEDKCSVVCCDGGGTGGEVRSCGEAELERTRCGNEMELPRVTWLVSTCQSQLSRIVNFSTKTTTQKSHFMNSCTVESNNSTPLPITFLSLPPPLSRPPLPRCSRKLKRHLQHCPAMLTRLCLRHIRGGSLHLCHLPNYTPYLLKS